MAHITADNVATIRLLVRSLTKVQVVLEDAEAEVREVADKIDTATALDPNDNTAFAVKEVERLVRSCSTIVHVAQSRLCTVFGIQEGNPTR